MPERSSGVPVSLALTLSDRVQALFDGTVKPSGVDLQVLRGTTDEIFYRMLRHREYDVAEMSLAAYTVERSRGMDGLIAIPVFPSRMFRHGSLYVSADSPISDPAQLAGTRVGTPDYQMTAGIWVRDFLEDEYGVDPACMEWSIGGVDTPNRPERLEFRPPGGLAVKKIAPTETLSGLLSAGAIDAMLTPQAPAGFVDGGPIRRLFDDPMAVERSYFERTGIFPIMHTVVVRRELVDQHPWIPEVLYGSFVQAKRTAWERLRESDYLPYGLVWFVEAQLQQRALFGDEHWPYGVPANRRVLERFANACARQGLTDRRIEIESLFVPSTVDDDRT